MCLLIRVSWSFALFVLKVRNKFVFLLYNFIV
nr:MAG TPA: hypothetical protein [Caudoviricetes sp.]DAO14392.1 MAG TPA: hypothetical protein [Caudoviricetes sp.]DAW27379.1 MAG TPA: hypothetical protein [Caudoviricetes sp.]